MSKILFNGNIVEREKMIDIEDRGYQFGDGIYEVIGIYDTTPFLMDEHLQRLQRSANELSLKLPFSLAEIKEKLQELVRINEVKEGIVYIQITRGVAPRTHELPKEEVKAVVVAYTKPLEDISALQDQGSIAIFHEDIRWLRCDIKTLNLLPNTMAKQKAVEKGAVEAILHRGDIVTEGGSSNVFIVKSGTVLTHPANNYILNGITRQKVIELCMGLDIPVKEEAFTVEELLHADEVFITATKLDVIPITKVNEKLIGTGRPGEFSSKLLKAFRRLTNI